MRRGVVTTLAGALLPALAAVLCIRWVLAGLGPARFGVLAVAWSFINSVGLLDLGIGRALTRMIAVGHEPDSRREGQLIWTSLAVISILGLAATASALALAHPLATLFARNAPGLLGETKTAISILSFSVPLVVLSSGFRGILEGSARFDLINRVSIPASILNLVVPVVLLRWHVGLPGIVAALVIVRLVATGALLSCCLHTTPSMRHFRVSRGGMRPLATFAGWIAVSNATGPLYAQIERFLLGTLASPAAVAFFATPADLLSRLTIIPGAVLQVLFPVLAQSVRAEPARTGRIFAQGSLGILAATFPPALLLAATAPELLTLWLGGEFATHASTAARLLAGGVFLNCMAWLPFSLVQSAGRADLTGKLHLVEIPLYFALTGWLVTVAGVSGGALAVLLRSAADGIVVGVMAGRLAPGIARSVRRLGVLVAADGASIVLVGATSPLDARAVLTAVALVGSALLGWYWVLDQAGRASLRSELATARAVVARRIG